MVLIKLLSTFKGHISIIWSIIWGMAGNFLISIGIDSSLIVWGPFDNYIQKKFYKKNIGESVYFKSWSKLHQLKLSQISRTFRYLSRKINSNYFSVADFQGNMYLLGVIFIKCYKICFVEIKHILKGHSSEVKGCDFSFNENLLASCGRDRSIRIWKNSFKKKIECEFVFKENKSDIKSVKWNPYFKELIASTYEGDIRLIVYKESIINIRIKLSNSIIWSLSFDGIGKEVVLGNGTGELIILNLNSFNPYISFNKRDEKKYQKLLLIFFFGPDTLNFVSLSNKNYFYASGNSSGLINLAKKQKIIKNRGVSKNKVLEGKFTASLSPGSIFSCFHFGKVNTILWHPIFENIFVSCGDDSFLNIWRVE